MTRIAVLGATGYLGGHAVTRLLADGHTVRALVRSPESADVPDAVEVVQADVERPQTLAPALQDVDAVVVTLNGGSDPERATAVEDTGIEHLALAAASQGVQRVILLTGMYSQPDYADYSWERAKMAGAQKLMDSQVPWTVFRIGFINETLAQFVRGGRPVLLGAHPHPVRPIAAADIMAAASRALSLPQTAGQVYDVAGTESLQLRDAVAAYASAVGGKEVTSRQVRVMPLPFMRVINRLFMGGSMTRVLGIMTSMNTYGDVTDTTGFYRDFGTPATDFATWLEQQRAQAGAGTGQSGTEQTGTEQS